MATSKEIHVSKVEFGLETRKDEVIEVFMQMPYAAPLPPVATVLLADLRHDRLLSQELL